jgi:hypothetical protein
MLPPFLFASRKSQNHPPPQSARLPNTTSQTASAPSTHESIPSPLSTQCPGHHLHITAKLMLAFAQMRAWGWSGWKHSGSLIGAVDDENFGDLAIRGMWT